MPLELEDVSVTIAGRLEPSSTTVAAAGGYVLVVASTLPVRAIGIISCYLGQLEGAIAASHLHLGPARHEHVTQRVIAPGQLHATIAGACLLDHAAELQQALAAQAGAHVAVDVGLAALERAAQAWGPPAPDA